MRPSLSKLPLKLHALISLCKCLGNVGKDIKEEPASSAITDKY